MTMTDRTQTFIYSVLSLFSPFFGQSIAPFLKKPFESAIDLELWAGAVFLFS